MAVKNKDLLDIFLTNPLITKETNHSRNLFIVGNRLINYKTCIAMIHGDTLYLNNKDYSMTTRGHQNYLLHNWDKKIRLIDTEERFMEVIDNV